MKIQHSVIIQRPMEEVFAFVTDLRNETRWQPEIKSVTLDGAVAAGATFREERVSFGRRFVWRFRITRCEAPRCIEIGQLSYDQADRVVKIGGQLVELSAREIGLLEIFLLRVGRLVSKDQLVDHLCGWGEEVSSNAIEVYVHRLRKKLEDSGVRIVTVRGLGYCLENPDAAPAAKVQA